MDKRSAWNLREGDRVRFAEEIWTVKQNNKWQNTALIARDGFVENVMWPYLKKVPGVQLRQPGASKP